MSGERDYVLGTHDDEIERLGLQHRVWRPQVTRAWREAGFGSGQRLLDVGCGPGWATVDLAALAGRSGQAVGVDRSRRFLDAGAARARALALGNVEWHEQDLDEGALPVSGMDGAWARWVFAFVRDPRGLLTRVAAALRPGGVFVAHEYADYRAWRVAPEREEFAWFVEQVMASWREAGGEPDIGLRLPLWLTELGFEVRARRALLEAPSAGDLVREWPDAFVSVGIERLVSLGRMSAERAAAVRRAYDESQRTPGAFQLTPTVLEVIAVKPGAAVR